MIKRLLTLAAVAAVCSNINAAEVTLWEGSCNFGTGWDQNASFAIDATDLAVLPADQAVLKLHYTLDTDCTYWQYKPCSNGAGWKELNVATELGNSYSCISVDAGSTSTDLPLGAADIATIKANGMRLQGYGMTMTKVTVDSDAEINDNLLWEGTYTISGWNSGAKFAASKVKAGDILCYTFTDAGTSSAQVIIKGSNWANLNGTAKITGADMAKGKVYVGVTESMLASAGGEIFLQGEGECVVTKVEKTGETFDAAGVVAYGERHPGVQFFDVLPDDITKLAIVYTTTPGWAQLCNSSWTDLELANTPKNNADGTVTVTYDLTAAALADFIAKKEFIINGDTDVLYAYLPEKSSAGINDITVDENAPVEYYNLQGVRVANPENGLYIRRQGNKATKVLVK